MGRMILGDTRNEELPWHVLGNTAYNRIKWLVVIVLPAGGTLYFALATIWGLPSAEQVLGTVLAVQAFLGVVLGISSSNYKNSDARFDGTVTISETPDKHIVAVEGIHPDEMANKDEVTLRVK